MSDYQMQDSTDAKAVNLVYLLNFIGYFTVVTWIIGVVIAYAKRDQASSAERSHFEYQIQTFWGEMILFIIGFFTMFILIGFAVFFFAFAWSLARNITGFLAANDGHAIRSPKGWGLARRA